MVLKGPGRNTGVFFCFYELSSYLAVMKLIKRIKMPLFEIASNPQIKLSNIKARKFLIGEPKIPEGVLRVWDTEECSG
jgi:hypothetical protein